MKTTINQIMITAMLACIGFASTAAGARDSFPLRNNYITYVTVRVAKEHFVKGIKGEFCDPVTFKTDGGAMYQLTKLQRRGEEAPAEPGRWPIGLVEGWSRETVNTRFRQTCN